MSLQKSTSQAMKYELAGSKKVNGKSVAIKSAKELSTGRLAWIIVTRHKLAILATGNVILVLNTIAPFWWDLVTGAVKSLIR